MQIMSLCTEFSQVIRRKYVFKILVLLSKKNYSTTCFFFNSFGPEPHMSISAMLMRRPPPLSDLLLSSHDFYSSFFPSVKDQTFNENLHMVLYFLQ